MEHAVMATMFARRIKRGIDADANEAQEQQHFIWTQSAYVEAVRLAGPLDSCLSSCSTSVTRIVCPKKAKLTGPPPSTTARKKARTGGSGSTRGWATKRHVKAGRTH